MYLGLHLGVAFYGNIGSRDRLDFTVVGPAVNEVSRIAAMCRSVDQPILMSSAFVASIAEEHRRRFASVGRFALRGIGEPQELYTLDTQGLRPRPQAFTPRPQWRIMPVGPTPALWRIGCLRRGESRGIRSEETFPRTTPNR